MELKYIDIILLELIGHSCRSGPWSVCQNSIKTRRLFNKEHSAGRSLNIDKSLFSFKRRLGLPGSDGHSQLHNHYGRHQHQSRLLHPLSRSSFQPVTKKKKKEKKKYPSSEVDTRKSARNKGNKGMLIKLVVRREEGRNQSCPKMCLE